MNGKTIATKLHNIENGIWGVQNNSETQDKLCVFGYIPEHILVGRRLLDKVLELAFTQREKYSDQYIATFELGKQWKTGCHNYMITLYGNTTINQTAIFQQNTKRQFVIYT